MFDINGKLWGLLIRMTDLIFLNILFVLFSLPVFTFGASKSALYDQVRNLMKGDNTQIFKNFYKSFMIYFKRSTLILLFYLLCLAFISLNIYAILQLPPSGLTTLFTMSTTFVFVVLNITFFYMIVLNVYFENSLKNVMINGFKLALVNLPKTILLVFIEYLPVIIFFFFTHYFLYLITIYLVIGFSLSASINTNILMNTLPFKHD